MEPDDIINNDLFVWIVDLYYIEQVDNVDDSYEKRVDWKNVQDTISYIANAVCENIVDENHTPALTKLKTHFTKMTDGHVIVDTFDEALRVKGVIHQDTFERVMYID